MDRGPGALSEREAAAAWHDRLHRDQVSEEMRQAFNEWLDEAPGRRELYRTQSEVWANLRVGGGRSADTRASAPDLAAIDPSNFRVDSALKMGGGGDDTGARRPGSRYHRSSLLPAHQSWRTF